MPVSGQTSLTDNGLRVRSIRDLREFKKGMNEIGIKVFLTKREKFSLEMLREALISILDKWF